MPKLAVIILTKNEEKNIEDCIRSSSFADEIVVIDSGSTDRTQELAEAAGARFIVHPMDEAGFAGQRNFALRQTDADWIFYLDADERITLEAATEIQIVVQRNEPAAWQIKRSNIVFGKRMNYGGHRPDYVARFFPHDGIHWRGNVHEGIETDLPIKKLTHIIEHYTYTTWYQYFEKFNQYTALAAQALSRKGNKVSQAAAFGHAFAAFFRDYILRRGFMDGFLGLVMSIMAGIYTLVKYLKAGNINRLQQKGQ